MGFVLVIHFALVLLMKNAHAQECNPDQDINGCYPALLQRGSPSPTCCNELVLHKDCFCAYLNINRPVLPPNYPFLRNICSSCGFKCPDCPE